MRAIRTSAPILVIANATPLVGVVYFGWDTFHILFLFWCENIILGAINMLRIATAVGDQNLAAHIAKPFAMAAFAAYFGIFTIAHGQMLLTLLGEEHLGWSPSDFGPDFFTPPFYALVQLWPQLWFSFLALCASHLVSFVLHDLRGGEYRRTRVGDAMNIPFKRLVIVHITAACGALVLEATGSAYGLLALLVALKTIADLWAHTRQHRADPTQAL